MKELKNYQQNAIDQLMQFTEMFLKTPKNETIIFQSPTGSGKTITIARYIHELTKETKQKQSSQLYKIKDQKRITFEQFFHNSSLTCDVACRQYQPTKKRYKTIKQSCYNPLYVKQCKQERVDLQRSVESPLN